MYINFMQTELCSGNIEIIIVDANEIKNIVFQIIYIVVYL